MAAHKRHRQARIHPRRPHRPCQGELVQIDGSPHDWLEGRGPRCPLIVFIDDATREQMALRFVPAETIQAYMETLDGYLQQHGRPVALYSDKHSPFRVNHPEHEGKLTPFTRPGPLRPSTTPALPSHDEKKTVDTAKARQQATLR